VQKKIFCIGFHKTGTKTLKKALEILGYSVTGPNEVQNKNIKEELYIVVDALVPKYDAFQDNPWPLVYKYLDKKYPNSKFILTLRDDAEWYSSALRYFGEKTTPMREFIYDGVGSPVGNESHYKDVFNRHNKEVQEYFLDRNSDFLQLNFFDGDAWEKLCKFLDKEMPREHFPHLNKGR